MASPPKGRSTPGAGGGLGGAYDPVAAQPLQTVPGGVGDLGVPSSLIVVPGFSTDADGNIVTQATLGATQQAANQYVAGGSSRSDWVDTFWGSLGLDQATIGGLRKAISGLTDPTQIQAIGQNYLRQTPWYQQTFPGFDQGVTAGLFTNESGYRSYVNQLTQASQQYLGRAVSTQEVTQALREGINPTLYANRLQGNALAQSLGPGVQYETGAFGGGQLTQQELQAYGQEQAGIDTQLGQTVTQRVQQAQARLAAIFQGRIANPNFSQTAAGIAAPGLQSSAQGRGGNADVAAT